MRHDVNGAEVEIPVLVKRGEAGSTTLSERTRALAADHYRVEKYRVACPADVDGDGLDDLIELAGPKGKNPANPAKAVASRDGAVRESSLPRPAADHLSTVGHSSLVPPNNPRARKPDPISRNTLRPTLDRKKN